MAFPRALLPVFSMVLMSLSCVQSDSHYPGSVAPASVIKAGYYPSWSSTLTPSAINTNLFTHVFYAFLKPSNVTFKFEVSNDTAASLLNFTSALRFSNPPVKTLLSIGGESTGSMFAQLGSNPSSRKSFIESSLEVARKFGFDGLDLDWEFPQSDKEMNSYDTLLNEWRVAIRNEAKLSNKTQLLLTAAVYFSSNFSVTSGTQGYPITTMNKCLDWLNVMAYDYHGAWGSPPFTTGPLASFFDPNSKLSSEYGLKSWLDAGIPGEKIVMGLVLYGRTWTLKDPTVNSIGAPGISAGPGNGTLTISQIDEFNKNSSATVIYDADTISVYSYAGTSWIGYDNQITLTTKVAYAQALRLRGYFFWALGFEEGWNLASQVSKAWIV